MADELNPLTISHNAITISCTPIGAIKKIAIVGETSVIATSIEQVKIAIAAIKPQADIHRGMSFDLYKTE